MPAHGAPIGLEVARAGRVVHRAFNDALLAVGGSLPAWLILTTLKRADHPRQRDIAAAVGLEDATLTHHLNRMEQEGLVSRRREPTNRRNQVVALTSQGERLFQRMRTTVVAFDARLRDGLTDDEIDQLRGLLARLCANVAEPPSDPRPSDTQGKRLGRPARSA